MPPLRCRNEKMEAVLENAFVLIYDKKISSMKDMIGVLEGVAGQRRGLIGHVVGGGHWNSGLR